MNAREAMLKMQKTYGMNQFMSVSSIADMLEVTEERVWMMVVNGKIPKPVEVDDDIFRWKSSDIEKAFKNRPKRDTDEMTEGFSISEITEGFKTWIVECIECGNSAVNVKFDGEEIYMERPMSTLNMYLENEAIHHGLSPIEREMILYSTSIDKRGCTNHRIGGIQTECVKL